MHESQQYKRVNQSMSVDSANNSLSKITNKKSPFYKHDDFNKLNYYARFSPNRKKIDQEFESYMEEGMPPLSPRSNRSPPQSKKSAKSMKCKIFLNDGQKLEGQKFELIDESLLLSINQKHQERGQIFIEQEQDTQNDSQQVESINVNKIIPNYERYQIHSKPEQNCLKVPKNLPKHEGNKDLSQSNQSSSFQRMIEPSSSDENEAHYVPKVSTGRQMLIQDDDSSQEENMRIQHASEGAHIKYDDQIMILGGSDKKILQLAKSIGAVKVDKNENISGTYRQVKSENVSFSFDSDLSMIEEKWNSYFEIDNDEISDKNDPKQRKPFFNENISQIGQKHIKFKNNELKRRKASQSSSDGQLPSFSNPNTSNYITPLQSQPQSLYDEESQTYQNSQVNNNEKQTKQFKRQFTFANELNVAFSGQQVEKNQNPKKGPLFTQFLSKNVLESFVKAKNGKKSNNEKTKKEKIKKEVNPKQSSDKKKPNKFNQSGQYLRHQSKNDSKFQIQTPNKIEQPLQIEIAQIIQLYGNEILIQQGPEEDQTIQSESNYQKPIQNCNETFDIFFPPSKQSLQMRNIESYNFSLTSKSQVKAKKRAIWQKTLKTMFQKQMKQKAKIQQEHALNIQEEIQLKLKQNDRNIASIIIEDNYSDEEQQNQSFHSQKEDHNFLQAQNVRIQKPVKQAQLTGYAKIYSEKKIYKGSKYSNYHNQVNLSEIHGPSSDEDSASQNFVQKPPKNSDGESFTTATQEVTPNTYQAQLYYNSPKKKSSCKQEVQNLKKYLKKLQNSPVQQKKGQQFQISPQIHESLEEPDTERSLQHEFVSENKSYKQAQPFSLKLQNPQEQEQQFKAKQLEDQSQEKDFLEKPIQPLFKSENKSDLDQLSVNQVQRISKESQHSHKTHNFVRSLEKLQNLIPTLPPEFMPVYEKIYTQVYEQQLKYQQKLQKQKFLLDFMQQFVEGQKQKIDCEGFLSYDGDYSVKDTSNLLRNEEFQIFINKHLILTLVRKLASEPM